MGDDFDMCEAVAHRILKDAMPNPHTVTVIWDNLVTIVKIISDQHRAISRARNIFRQRRVSAAGAETRPGQRDLSARPRGPPLLEDGRSCGRR